MRNKFVYIIIILTLGPWAVFLFYFYDQRVIYEMSAWSNLGGYIGGITAALTLPITLTFVYKSFISQKNVERQAICSATHN